MAPEGGYVPLREGRGCARRGVMGRRRLWSIVVCSARRCVHSVALGDGVCVSVIQGENRIHRRIVGVAACRSLIIRFFVLHTACLECVRVGDAPSSAQLCEMAGFLEASSGTRDVYVCSRLREVRLHDDRHGVHWRFLRE